MHTKTSVFLDANISKTNEAYMYADVFADNDALNPYAFTGSLNYSLNDGNLVKEEISISIEEYTKNLETFVYNFYIARYQDGNDELEINTNQISLNDSSKIIFNANSLISVLQNSYHYLNMEDVISPSMFEFYRLNNNLSLQLTFNQNNISKFIDISSLENISVEDLNIIGEEIYTFNEDGYLLNHSINLIIETNLENQYPQITINVVNKDEILYNQDNLSSTRYEEYANNYLEHIK